MGRGKRGGRHRLLLAHFHLLWMKVHLLHCHPRMKRTTLLQSKEKDGKRGILIHGPSRKYCKFKERGKSINFLTYNQTFSATDKILAFIQQDDASLGDEDFSKSSKLRNVAMHFMISAC